MYGEDSEFWVIQKISNSKIKICFVILIFLIFEYQNISRSTFGNLKFWSPLNPHFSLKKNATVPWLRGKTLRWTRIGKRSQVPDVTVVTSRIVKRFHVHRIFYRFTSRCCPLPSSSNPSWYIYTLSGTSIRICPKA